MTDVGNVVSLYTPATPSIRQIKSLLKHLNPRKATGAKGIHACRLLKRFHEELAPVVHDILSVVVLTACNKHALLR